jgi:hypothetical protein
MWKMKYRQFHFYTQRCEKLKRASFVSEIVSLSSFFGELAN